MKRETRAGILRTALVTHQAKHGIMLPEVDQFIDRVCDAMDEQDKRDTQAAGVLAKLRNPVLAYSGERVRDAGVEGPFVFIADGWTTATRQYLEGNPDSIVKLLHEDLARKQATAESRGGQDTCSGPSRARGQAAMEAREIVELLWCIADEFGVARVWGDDAELRTFERTSRQSDGLIVGGHSAFGK